MIVASDGSILGKLGDREGVSVFEVELTRHETTEVPKDYSGWLHEGNFIVRHVMMPFDVWQGQRSYHTNKKKYKPFRCS